MARPVRIEYAGALYHIVTRGNNRQSVFRDDHDRARYLERLAFYCEEKEIKLLCYCLMTNHVHLLLETPKGNLSKMMQAFQTSYTVYFNIRHHRSGHLFEQRYKAFVVDKDNYLLQVSRYIHLNPVEAGIVEKPQEYRWSSYRKYVRSDTGSVLNTEVILDQFEGTKRDRTMRYREFVEEAVKKGEPWTVLPIVQQVFVGEEGFIRQAKKNAGRGAELEELYGIKEIARVVGKVMGLEEKELRRPLRREEIQRGREILVYVARRHGQANLKELAAWLGVKELSTVTHGVRRAEARLEKDRVFGRQVQNVLKRLSH